MNVCIECMYCKAPGAAPPKGAIEEARGNGHSCGTRLGGARADGSLEEGRRRVQREHQGRAHHRNECEVHRGEDDEGWFCLASFRRCEQTTKSRGGMSTMGSRHDDVATTDEGESRLARVGSCRIDEPRRPGAARICARACGAVHVGDTVLCSPLLLY